MQIKIHTLLVISLPLYIHAIDTSNDHIKSDGVGETYISGTTFTNKKVYYSIDDDKAIYEGDILLSTVDQAEIWKERQEAIDNTSSSNNNMSNAQIINGARYRWPNGIIPYTISPNVSSRTRTLISRAISHITSRTHVRFIPKASNHSNYLNITSAQDSCYSQVGNLKVGQQLMNVVADCQEGGIIHELTHTIGLWHEQSRSDRNKYIRINWSNIRPGQAHNFNQHIHDGIDMGPYDYGSLMHYGRNYFGIDGRETITPLRNVSIGQRNGLSQGDINAINRMYPNSGGGGTSSSTQWTTGAYSNNQDISKTLSISGASTLSVRISGTTEKNYDFIYIYNANGQVIKKLHGNINTTFSVSGSSIRARLTSDTSITKNGVTVSISKASAKKGGSNSTISYTFNNNRNSQGWKYINMRQQYNGPYQGAWFFACNSSDPQLISPNLNLNTTNINKVQIRIANNNPSAYSWLQVFWKTNYEPYFSESKSKYIKISNHGGWSTYSINMQHSKWRGTIKQIRIDPVTRGDGSWIAIDNIRFTL